MFYNDVTDNHISLKRSGLTVENIPHAFQYYFGVQFDFELLFRTDKGLFTYFMFLNTWFKLLISNQLDKLFCENLQFMFMCPLTLLWDWLLINVCQINYLEVILVSVQLCCMHLVLKACHLVGDCLYFYEETEKDQTFAACLRHSKAAI